MFDDDDLIALIPNLTLFAHKLAGDNAEDLVQATLEKALIKRHQFIPGSTLIYWLNRIMHNTFLDIIRTEHKNRYNQLDDDIILVQPPNQEDAVALNQAIEAVYSLKPLYRDRLIMSSLGYTSLEIAVEYRNSPRSNHRYGKTDKAMQMSIRNCLKKARQQLSKDF